MQNRATQEAREFATAILESPEYRASLALRIRTGDLPPQIETLLYYYRYGKPKDRVEIEVTSPVDGTDLGKLTFEELAQRNAMVQAELEEEVEREKQEQEAARMAAEIQRQREVAESLEKAMPGSGQVM